MKNKQSRNLSKNKRNPLHRQTQLAMRPKSNFDGQTLNFKNVRSELTAAANVLAHLITVSTTAGAASGSIGESIAKNYSEYVYDSLVFRWLPSVGPGVAAAGGRGYVGYTDNAEMMMTYAGATATGTISAVKSHRNMKSFNVWEPFVYSVPLTRRRKTFDTNSTIETTVDVYDRSVQGMVVFGAETVGATDTIGRWQVEGIMTLKGMVLVST